MSRAAKFLAVAAGALSGCGFLLAAQSDGEPTPPPSIDAADDSLAPDAGPLPGVDAGDGPPAYDGGLDSSRSWFENFDDAATNVDPNYGFVSFAAGGTRSLITARAFSSPNSLELTGQNRLRRQIPNVDQLHAELRLQVASPLTNGSIPSVLTIVCDHNVPLVSLKVDASYHIVFTNEISGTTTPPVPTLVDTSWVDVALDVSFTPGAIDTTLSLGASAIQKITIASDCSGPAHEVDVDFGSDYKTAPDNVKIDVDDVAMAARP